MNALSLRRRAPLRLVRQTPQPDPPPGKPVDRPWGPLAAPVDPLETQLRMRAQSLLSGTRFRDGGTGCPPLSIEQAHDVMRWYRPPSA